MADEDQCVFCHIANGKIPAKKVYEDEHLAAVLDINPAAEGHLLLIPKKHVAMVVQMDAEAIAHAGMVAKQLSGVLIRALKCEGTSMFAANGAAAGQRAPHVMFHLIPRREGDDVGLTPKAQKIEEKAMKLIYEKLGQGVAKQFGKEPPKFSAAPQAEGSEGKTRKEEKKPAKTDSNAGRSSLDDITDFLAGGKK